MIRTFALTFTLIISHISVYSLKHIIHDSYFGFCSKQKKNNFIEMGCCSSTEGRKQNRLIDKFHDKELKILVLGIEF